MIRRRLAIIVVAALALRLLYVLVIFPDLDSLGLRGGGDWSYYHELANVIADGHGVVDPGQWNNRRLSIPVADHAPLWPLLLSAVSAVGTHGVLTHRLVGCLLGTVAVFLIALLARRVAGDRVALFAAALASIYPILIAADGSLMTETLYGVLVLTSVLAAIRLADGGARRWALALGVAIGLAALARSEALLLLPLLAAPLVLRRPGPLRRRVGLVALVVAAACLTIAPWTARNLISLDRPILISTSDASVIGGANCHSAYYGRGSGGWRIECLKPLPVDGNGVADAPKWRRDGLTFAGRHAGRLPAVVALRVMRTWDLWLPRAQAIYATERSLPVQEAGLVVFYLLVMLAVIGAVLLRRRQAPMWPLLVPIVLVSLVSALGYGSDRFRHPADFALVILSAVSLDAVASRRQR